MTKKRKKDRAMTSTPLADFGTPELRQHGTVVIEDRHEGTSTPVRRARVITPLEEYHARGLLALDLQKGEENDAALAAGQRFFVLWHRYHVIIGTPKTRSTLSEWVSGGIASLYEGENDAKVQAEYTDLKAYVGGALFPYLEDVAGEGWYAEEVCPNHRCNRNQFLHCLRLGLAACVKFWS